MKPLFCLFSLVLCVSGQQTERYISTQLQQSLLDAIVDEFGAVLSGINSANPDDVPLNATDPPPAQSFSDSFDEGLGGTLYLSNIVIDGLSGLADQIEITSRKMGIRIKTKLNELIIHGDYNIEGYNGEYETGTFSVVLSNVKVLGVVSLLKDPHGNVKINKVTPTILSEHPNETIKSEIIPPDFMLRSVRKHVENAMRYSLTRLATMEVQFQHPDTRGAGSSTEVKPLNRTLYEAKKYVDYGFNPYKMKMTAMRVASSTWHIGAFNIHGFSNFFVDKLDLSVNDNGTAIKIICRLIGADLYGKFPLAFPQGKYVGDYSVEKFEVWAQLVIPIQMKAPPIRLETVVIRMTRCSTRIRDRATGQSIDNSEFGFDVEGLLCLLLKNKIPTEDIKTRVQIELLDRMDTFKFKPKIDAVVKEEEDLSLRSLLSGYQ